MKLYKRYVDVELLKKKNGTEIPQELYWYNGRPEPDRYEITKIIKTEERSYTRVGESANFM